VDDRVELEGEDLFPHDVEVAFGAARFLGNDTIAIGDRQVTSRHFIVCTGAEPVVPSIPGLAESPFLTYKDVFSLKALPRRLHDRQPAEAAAHG